MHKNLILQEARKQGITSIPQLAYILATAYWETNKTLKPVKEAYWLSEDWRKKNLRYYPYYGRGFVQLTWDYNYKRYSDILKEDFIKNPDLVMEPEIAAYILVHGMINGIFTGKKLSDYISSNEKDYVGARRLINGSDRALDIARIAEDFEKELEAQRGSYSILEAFVKELQELLNKYSDVKLAVDGKFGPRTNSVLEKLLDGRNS